jgi:hypothetical protein
VLANGSNMPSGTQDPGGHIAQTGLRASAAKWLALASRGATNFPLADAPGRYVLEK